MRPHPQEGCVLLLISRAFLLFLLQGNRKVKVLRHGHRRTCWAWVQLLAQAHSPADVILKSKLL